MLLRHSYTWVPKWDLGKPLTGPNPKPDLNCTWASKIWPKLKQSQPNLGFFTGWAGGVALGNLSCSRMRRSAWPVVKISNLYVGKVKTRTST